MTDQLVARIKELKEKNNAALIAHFYQVPEIQDIADFVGDSLAMARYGKESDADMLIICGVKFMAESAKILSPEKTVLLSNGGAGCPMADMVDAQALKAHKEEHPNQFVVSYVNTSADVKALTDICVTSSNAMKIVTQLDARDILFLPDKNLGGYIAKQLPEKKIELWPGYCFTHDRLRTADVAEMKELHPDAKVLVHPECDATVVDMADFVGSTAGIINYAKESDCQSFIIATEEGVMHRLTNDSPHKDFYLASPNLVCKNMKKSSLNDLLDVLENKNTEVHLDEQIRLDAYKALDRMLELS